MSVERTAYTRQSKQISESQHGTNKTVGKHGAYKTVTNIMAHVKQSWHIQDSQHGTCRERTEEDSEVPDSDSDQER